MALLAKFNDFNDVDVNVCGNLPEMNVSVRSSLVNFGRLAISCGIEPCNMFLLRLSTSNSVSTPSSGGINPDRPLDSKLIDLTILSPPQVIPSQSHIGMLESVDQPLSVVDKLRTDRSAFCCCSWYVSNIVIYSVNRLLLWCCYKILCVIAKIKIGWSDAYFLQISLINIEEKNNDRSAVDEDHTNQYPRDREAADIEVGVVAKVLGGGRLSEEENDFDHITEAVFFFPLQAPAGRFMTLQIKSSHQELTIF